MNFDPYISFIVTSRNDDHGGDLLKRMQIFINTLIEQSNLFKLKSELIIVEWNPPADKPKLKKALNWPKHNGYCQIRIIEVPPLTHQKFKNSDKLRLFQMIAKNVGIRRARGKFILSTNIDIVFSKEMMRFLAKKKLKESFMYRVDRYDVSSDLSVGSDLDEILRYCRQNIIRVHKRAGSILIKHSKLLTLYLLIYQIKDLIRWTLGKNPPLLHTNGCGDFTLMSNKMWHQVRGYPEFEIFSWKLDTLLCYIAYFAGAKELELKNPCRIYHLEHSPGSGWTPEFGWKKLLKRLDKLGVERLTSEKCFALIKRMANIQKPILFNSLDWGLKKYKPKESVIK